MFVGKVSLMDINPNKLNGVDQFLKECFQRFGYMNKNNYEVALFHLLMLSDYDHMTDFEISKALKTPESKIKRLRYEVELAYGEDDEAKLDLKIVSLLKHSSFKLTFERLQFAVSEKMTRLYINNKLQKENRFSDSSFNSNIVSISANDLQFLLDKLELDEKDRKEIINNVKKGIKESCEEMQETGKERILKFGKIILDIVAGKACETLIDQIFKELSTLLHK